MLIIFSLAVGLKKPGFPGGVISCAFTGKTAKIINKKIKEVVRILLAVFFKLVSFMLVYIKV